MANLAKLVVRLEAESSQLRKELEKTNKQLQKFGRNAQKTVDNIARSFKRLVGAYAGAEVIGAVYRDISNFGDALQNVAAVTQATEREMASLTQTARRLGATTQFSANEAAQGMEFLGRAGFETTEIVQSMPGLLNLAAAGAIDLGQAADIASNVLSGFNIEATKTDEVVDVLAATAAGSNTNIEQLGLAMQYVAPVAAAMGRSVQETSAAIGILGNAGIQASTAGTGLRGMLSRLANITPQATEALNAMGVKIEEVDPTTKSFVEIIDRLADAGLEAGDALTIFGDRAGPAVLALVSQREQLRKFTKTMDEATGTAQRMSDIMQDDLPGDVKAFGSAVSELFLKLGDAGLTGVLRTSLQALTDLSRGLSSFIEGDTLDELGRKLERARGESGGTRAGRRRRGGINKIQQEIQDKLEQLAGPAGARAQLARIDDEVTRASRLVRTIQEKIDAIPEAQQVEGSIGSGRSARKTTWSRLNDELRAATSELEMLSEERAKVFDELFELETKSGPGAARAAQAAVQQVDELAKKRIEAAKQVAEVEKEIVKQLMDQKQGFDELVKQARELINAEPKNPLTEGTLIEALRALENAKTLESAGDNQGAFKKAEETIQLVGRLVEAGKLSKQFANSLVDQAAEIGTAASDNLIELKLDDAAIAAEADRARAIIQSNFSAEPFTASISWLNPEARTGSGGNLAPGATRPDGTPIVFNLGGKTAQVEARGSDIAKLRRMFAEQNQAKGAK